MKAILITVLVMVASAASAGTFTIDPSFGHPEGQPVPCAKTYEERAADHAEFEATKLRGDINRLAHSIERHEMQREATHEMERFNRRNGGR